MKKFILMIIALSFFCFSAKSQSISKITFESGSKSINRSTNENKIFNILINTEEISNKNLADLSLTVKVNEEKTTLPASAYKIDFNEVALNNLKKTNTLYFTLLKDSIVDRKRMVTLDLLIKNKNGKVIDSIGGEYKKIELTIKEIANDTLGDFSYLAYIGTNFDLVDGIKAKNLFFAANVFLKPKNKMLNTGFYLSLFGNRTMTASDSLTNVKRIYKIGSGTDASSIYNYREQADLVTTKVSDNLGAYMSPLINLGNLSSSQNSVQLYYSPSLEFIWRRTQTANIFTNGRNRDSVLVSGINNGLIELGNKSVQYANEYNFNFGFLGVFIAHENKQISMRVHLSTGISRQYYPERVSNMSSENNIGYLKEGDIFFTGRAWITEASSGITLQAEVTNTRKNPKPYYGVTLSKALNFKNLGTIFSPIITR